MLRRTWLDNSYCVLWLDYTETYASEQLKDCADHYYPGQPRSVFGGCSEEFIVLRAIECLYVPTDDACMQGSEISRGIKGGKREIGMSKILEKRICRAGVRILRNKKRLKRTQKRLESLQKSLREVQEELQ